MMEPTSLDRFRRAVADPARGAELEKILRKLDKKGFRAESHDSLKRVPKGYDADHPRAELLRGKGLHVGFPDIPGDAMTTPKLLPWVAKQCKEVVPFVEWLVFATA
jgi:uncharacterized protein (DUF2461 family)